MNLSVKKRIILKVTIVAAVVLIICTFLSRTINTMLLPQVELSKITSGPIVQRLNTQGVIKAGGETEIIALAGMAVNAVNVSAGQAVVKGDVLFEVDSTEGKIEQKRLELNLIQKQNLLATQAITPQKKSEIEARLRIAEMELELFKINSAVEQEQKMLDYAMDMAQWREKSVETKEQLDLAIAEADKYNSQIGGNYDYAEAARLRLAVIQASNNLLLLDPRVLPSQKNAVQLEYEAALREYEKFASVNQVNSAISEERLNLSIIEYKNQLNSQSLTESQQREYKMQVEIAKNELDEFKKGMPLEGKIVAKEDGIIAEIKVRAGEKAEKGKQLATFISNTASYSLVWNTSLEAGNLHSLGGKVATSYFVIDEKGGLKEEKSLLKVTGKTLDDNGTWRFSAEFPADKADISTRLPATVDMTTETKVYFKVFPKSCVQSINDEFIVRTVKRVEGLFGMQDVVAEHSVEILYENSLEVAVDCNTIVNDEKVIQYTSRPLSDGDRVAVME